MNFLDRLSKNTQISNFMKIHSAGAELLHVERQTDRQTDMMRLTVAFQNFRNAPKNQFTCTNHVTYKCKLLLKPKYTNYLLVMLK
jgi:hypothetical protein